MTNTALNTNIALSTSAAAPLALSPFWRWHYLYWGCYLALKSCHVALLVPLQGQPVLPSLLTYVLLCLICLLYTAALARPALQQPRKINSWLLAAALLPLLLLLLPLRLYLLTRFGTGDSSSFTHWYHYLVSGIMLLLLPLAGWLALLLCYLKQQRSLAQQLQQQQLQSQALQARLKLLRYQSDPHFMFNTLTAINTLIVQRAGQQAEHLIQLLTDFLRHALRGQTAEQVPLTQEINALKTYFAILQHRFGDRLQIDWQLNPPAGAVLPPLLLQTLAEQLVQATVAQCKQTVHLSIYLQHNATSITLVFCDAAAWPSTDTPKLDHADTANWPLAQQPVALQQLQQRLSLYYGAKASLLLLAPAQGFYAKLQLPGVQHA